MTIYHKATFHGIISVARLLLVTLIHVNKLNVQRKVVYAVGSAT